MQLFIALAGQCIKVCWTERWTDNTWLSRQHKEFLESQCAKSLKIPVLILLELLTNTARQAAVFMLN